MHEKQPVQHANTVITEGQTAADGQAMACSDTCNQFSASEVAIVNNTELCPAGDSTKRETTIATDLSNCLTTGGQQASASNCILGSDNEGNCGYGNSTTELCSFCGASSPETCCNDVDLVTMCGFALSASATATGATTTGTGSAVGASSGSKKSGISSGAIAGIVVGVVGGLAVLGAIAFFMWRRNKRSTNSAADGGHSPFIDKDEDRLASPDSTPSATNQGLASESHNGHGARNAAIGVAGAAAVGGALAAHHNRAPSPPPKPVSPVAATHPIATANAPTASAFPQSAPNEPPSYNSFADEPVAQATRTPAVAAVPSAPTPRISSTPAAAAAAAEPTNAGFAGRGAGHAAAVGTGLAVGAGALAAGAAVHHHNASSAPSAPSAPQVSSAPSGMTTSPSGAISVNSIPDQHNPGHWIKQGSEVNVLHPYAAALTDELTLTPGMTILVEQLFDDGWATGKVMDGDMSQAGKTGQFPAVCVSTLNA